MKITMAHGSGGRATGELIASTFAKYFNNPILNKMEDSAVVEGSGRLAMTTDSFVVTPLIYPGGDIGRLAICGTVNDLLMSGAVPKYITCGYILEDGADVDLLTQIVKSMAETAAEAGVTIVAGDTKVIEGNGGIYINTAGVGFLPDGINISAANCADGDAIIVSGNLGDHHAAILSTRMEIENEIQSDNAPLVEIVRALKEAKVELHAMRDVTRGGLATVLHEFAVSSGSCMELWEEKLPVHPAVQGFCNLLGLDPLYMGNEGKMLTVVPKHDAETALQAIRGSKYGEHAAIIGEVTHTENGNVLVHTKVGGVRTVSELIGEGLPRIC
ncbi:MAG: hydrogenase expression/formation protein HypE [Lachnospiraceae bacterium]|nr:hydrogenase expression/formation protein HypE [Lachnospiraceae bacterium]